MDMQKIEYFYPNYERKIIRRKH